MKLPVFLFCFIIGSLTVNAQIKAVTAEGEEVILYKDGTWKYVNEVTKIGTIIDTNKTAFTKSADATFLVKSSKLNMGIYLNPKKWAFKKSEASESAEFEFTLKNSDAYGMFIPERIEMPLDVLKTAALENAKSVAPDIIIVKEEYRMVNGVKFFLMQMNGTVQGVKFTYLGYYYSYAKGTVQLITYTSQNLLSEYQKELEGLLNGLVITE